MIVQQFLSFRRGRALPLVLQTEATECGLACLVMIADYHGHDLDLASTRRRFPVSLRGVALPWLVKTANALGFDCRALRIEMEHLPELKLPCVLHWNLNHFVVLKKVTATAIDIHDPAQGIRRVSLSEAGRSFSGVALEMTPIADFEPLQEKRKVSFKSLIGQVGGMGRAIAQVAGLAIALEIFVLLSPLFLRIVFDQVLVSEDRKLLWALAAGFLLIAVFQGLINVVRGWVISELGARLSTQWSNNVFGHLLRLPVDFFEKRHIGDILSRYGSIQLIQQTLTGNFVESILNGFTAVIIIVVLAVISLPQALIVLLGFGLYAAIRWLGYRRLATIKQEQLAILARQQTGLLESIHAIRTIKLRGKTWQWQVKVANLTINAMNRDIAAQRLGVLLSSAGQFLLVAQRIAVATLGAVWVLDGRYSAGVLVAVLAYSEQFTARGSALIEKFFDLRLLSVYLDRLADLVLTAPEALPRAARRLPATGLDIDIDGLGFRRTETEPWIFRDCSLRIAENESVAIVGPSGCGKSTLAKLILGLLQPTEGGIRLGGIPIDQFDAGDYRGLFGAVMQDEELLSGSLADNISFFSENATVEAIEHAARLASIHDEILAMPMGYETLVGDRGSALSGGQKQRVLLARALYNQPRILLLDEATSHLDVDRETLINEAIAAMRMTRIIIAHRAATIESADRVIHLEAALPAVPA